MKSEFSLTRVSPGLQIRVSEMWGWAERARLSSGREGWKAKTKRKSYVHGNIPGHVDVGLVFIHPHLSGSQGVAFGIIVYVVVVGLLGALDVGHSGAWQDFHAPSTLPHLNSKKNCV